MAAIAPSQLVHAVGGNAEVRDDPADVPLLGAAKVGDLTLLERLIEAGEAVNVGAKGQGTPLIQAALGGHRAAVELLLRSGADVNLAEMDGPRRIPRALIQAAGAGQMATVKLLIARGADVNKRV